MQKSKSKSTHMENTMIQTRTTQQRNKQTVETLIRLSNSTPHVSPAILTTAAVICIGVALSTLSASAQSAKDVKERHRWSQFRMSRR